MVFSPLSKEPISYHAPRGISSNTWWAKLGRSGLFGGTRRAGDWSIMGPNRAHTNRGSETVGEAEQRSGLGSNPGKPSDRSNPCDRGLLHLPGKVGRLGRHEWAASPHEDALMDTSPTSRDGYPFFKWLVAGGVTRGFILILKRCRSHARSRERAHFSNNTCIFISVRSRNLYGQQVRSTAQ